MKKFAIGAVALSILVGGGVYASSQTDQRELTRAYEYETVNYNEGYGQGHHNSVVKGSRVGRMGHRRLGGRYCDEYRDTSSRSDYGHRMSRRSNGRGHCY